MTPLLLALVLVLSLVALMGFCVVRSGSRADQLAAEIDARLFEDPETLPALPAVPDPASSIGHPASAPRVLVVPLLVEVDATTRFPGIPAADFDGQIAMVCARGARAYLDGETLGTEPRVSVQIRDLRIPVAAPASGTVHSTL